MSLISDLTTRALDVDFTSTNRTADARRFVLEAIGRIYRKTSLARAEYSLSFNLTAGTSSTPFAVNAPRVRTVLDAQTGAELDELTREQMRARQLSNVARGRPRAYAITGAGDATENLNLTFHPTADRTYSFELLGVFAPPTTDLEDADQVPLPVDYENLPVYYARRELFALEEDGGDGYALWSQKWTEGLAELAGDLQRTGSRNRIVPGTWGAADPGPQLHYPGIM